MDSTSASSRFLITSDEYKRLKEVEKKYLELKEKHNDLTKGNNSDALTQNGSGVEKGKIYVCLLVN